jgi:hypothetical protein
MHRRRIIVGLIHIDNQRTKVEIDLIYSFIERSSKQKARLLTGSHKQPESKIRHASHVHPFCGPEKGLKTADDVLFFWILQGACDLV